MPAISADQYGSAMVELGGMRRSRLCVMAVMLAVALVAGSCSSDEQPESGTGPATSTASATTAPIGDPLDLPLRTTEQGPVEVALEEVVHGVHDPAVAFEDGTYHLFFTGTWLEHRTSTDLVSWSEPDSVFDDLPTWASDELAPAPTNLWAPDLSWWGGQWHLYYAASVWPPGEMATRNSVIAHATTKTLNPSAEDFGWVDHGPVVRSAGPLMGEDRSGWNAIDASVVLDDGGAPWLVWGSGFEGLFLAPLLEDGTLDESVEPINVAQREDHPVLVVEAPTIVERDGWWYLFASYDLCCAGVRSNYNVRVGRSRTLTGPYVDQDGRALTDGGGTKILSAYGDVLGPGHQTVYEQGGTWWLLHHWYDPAADGAPALGIRPLDWDDDGWPVARGWTEDVALPGGASGRP